jgi:predicted ribosome quality control (RQC) complex YloA/Tae2 family protein
VHNNYYFLCQLTKKLESTLNRTVISQCFSQNKEELVIQLETNSSPFFIKASLLPQFSCLSFPTSFHRAKKNSVDLFQSLIGQHVESFRQFENERSFTMNCSNQLSLLFKMHGNRSNLILFDQGVVTEVFKSSVSEDENLNLYALDRVVDWSFEHFVSGEKSPESTFFTFGKVVWQYLKANHLDKLSSEEKWRSIQQVRVQLENPSAFYIREATGKIIFSLLDVGIPVKEIQDPIAAVTEFYSYYTQHDAFVREKASAMSALRSKLQANENYLRKTESKLRELEGENNYKVWADLLMANLHAIAPGSAIVTLANFYQENHPTEIKLKPNLSAQKNAAIFYKKGKNQQIEIDHLKKLVDDKKKECDTLATLLQQIETARDKKDLRNKVGIPDIENTPKKQVLSLPYRELEFNGYKIWIGRNAESNDTLTLKFGYKEDLWLHAKDVAGSHVLLKHQAGKKFPKDVIDRAAQLAAYYSKRKNESLCPVVVTPKKFVRKRKGDPAGVVVVEREEVVMVRPIGDR